MSYRRPPIAVDACGACDVTHLEGWGYTDEAGRHRTIPPSEEQRAERQKALGDSTGIDERPPAPQRIAEAMDLIEQFGGIDGDHHQKWLVDQIVRILKGSDAAYAAWVKHVEGDPNDEDNYYGPWDEGIAP